MYIWNENLIIFGWDGSYIYDSISTRGYIKWNGDTAVALFGENSNYGGMLYSMCEYQNDLSIGISLTGDTPNPGYDFFNIWNGNNISTFPSFQVNPPDRKVTSMIQHNGNLYLGGPNNYGSQPFNLMAYWDGNSIHSMNGGLWGDYARIYDMEIYKDELYVGGVFNNSQTGNPFNIARWDGEKWNDLDTGALGDVWSIVIDPDGQYLYAAGSFTFIGGNNGFPTCGIARWDGEQWSGLDLKNDAYCLLGIFQIFDLEFYHGELYASMAGAYPQGGESDTTLMKWNGQEWSPIMGFKGYILDLQVYNDELVIAGNISTLDDSPHPGLARWYSPPDTTLSVNRPLIEKTAWLWPPQPNPNSGRVLVPYFNPSGKTSTITITNNEGKTLATQPCKSQKNYWEINTSQYPKGIYYITMLTDGWKKQSQKMVVE